MLKYAFYLERIWKRLATGISATVVNTVNTNVQNFPANQTVNGTVNVGNFPAGYNVNNFPAGFNVNNFPASFQVSNFPAGFNVNNFPANQTVNGTVAVSNFPAFPAGYNVNNFPNIQKVQIVNPSSNAGGVKMDFVHTTPALNAGDVYTLLSYVVPAGKELVLDFIKFSSALDYKAEISIDSQEVFVDFGKGSEVGSLFKRKRPFAAGTVFNFKVTNRADPMALPAPTSIYISMSGDLY